MIRDAAISDLRQLVTIENRCFTTDRLSSRQFRHMLTKAHARTLVFDDDGQVLGYVLILFSRGTSMARLYSIAVLEEARGRGVARALVEAAEESSREEDRAYLRLEIRKDNEASIALFSAMKYKPFGEVADYYEDHMDAVRYEKSLAPQLNLDMVKVPYYEQTLDFTCGPAALMMAIKALDPALELNRKVELRIWREATTIFMTSGHGGCGPYGLAIAAAKRGCRVELYVNGQGVLLSDSVRNEQKKEVMRLVQEDMLEEIERRGIPVIYETLGVEQIRERLNDGAIPVVLTSSWLIYQEKFPHWVVITGFDDHFFYAHDPFVDYELGETRIDSINMPIPKSQFERMTRYGKAGLKAVLIISR